MAYREIAMWEILEVLWRVHRGEGQRAIQRVTGHGRTTIRRWVACATELGWAAAVQEPRRIQIESGDEAVDNGSSGS